MIVSIKSIVMIIFPKLLSEYPTSLYPSSLTWTALYMVLVTLIFPVTPVTVIFLDIKEEDFLSFLGWVFHRSITSFVFCIKGKQYIVEVI